MKKWLIETGPKKADVIYEKCGERIRYKTHSMITAFQYIYAELCDSINEICDRDAETETFEVTIRKIHR